VGSRNQLGMGPYQRTCEESDEMLLDAASNVAKWVQALSRKPKAMRPKKIPMRGARNPAVQAAKSTTSPYAKSQQAQYVSHPRLTTFKPQQHLDSGHSIGLPKQPRKPPQLPVMQTVAEHSDTTSPALIMDNKANTKTKTKTKVQAQTQTQNRMTESTKSIMLSSGLSKPSLLASLLSPTASSNKGGFRRFHEG
jgi:hypothetical protein